MKKFIVSVMIVSILLLLFGCTVQESPAYCYIDGEECDYIVLNMDFSQYKMDDCRGTWRIDFESPEEMIHDLKTGNLTEDELFELSRMKRDEKGRILIPNLDSLYRCMHPELTELQKVTLESGAVYSYNYEEGWVSFYPQEEYDYWVAFGRYDRTSWVTAETVDAIRAQYANKVDNLIYFSYRYRKNTWTAHISERYDAKDGEIGVLKSVLMYLDNGSGVYMYFKPTKSTEDFSVIRWMELFAVEKLQTP